MSSAAAKKVNNIDEESKQYMVHAESKCQRIKSGIIMFSPDSSIWIQRAQVYCSLLRLRAKKIKNRRDFEKSCKEMWHSTSDALDSTGNQRASPSL